MSRLEFKYPASGDRLAFVLLLIALLTVGALAGTAAAQEHQHAAPSPADNGGAVPLYDNLGEHHRPITTSSPLAQRYFDQGLRLQYAFNHAEAIRSYRAALREDHDCAMCWWGIALAFGPNINAGMAPEQGLEAHAAIGRAAALADGVSPVERDLIAALAQRYEPAPGAERDPGLDRAYARAMEELVVRYPQDADLLALYGAALMNLSPWDYWEGPYDERRPKGETTKIVAALQRAVALDPENPGACHYYIHAVEAAFPERALECADRLAALMPGAGHIVHMPGHIYIRVGRYAEAVELNEHAVHADESYIADQSPTGLYPSAYYPHNYHFMWFAASMAGMADRAMEAAELVAPKVPVEVAREIYFIQSVSVLPQLTAITFGRWDVALQASAPSAELPVATAMHHYARGVAAAGSGDLVLAEHELSRVEAIAADIAESADGAPTQPIAEIARHVLHGEILLARGDANAAVEPLRVAAELEDGMLYEEPPLWYMPVRHVLGRVLLAAGQPAAAEQAYREDLARFRENGWSLAGLARALEAQGRAAEAAAVWERYRGAWIHADLNLFTARK